MRKPYHPRHPIEIQAAENGYVVIIKKAWQNESVTLVALGLGDLCDIIRKYYDPPQEDEQRAGSEAAYRRPSA